MRIPTAHLFLSSPPLHFVPPGLVSCGCPLVLLRFRTHPSSCAHFHDLPADLHATGSVPSMTLLSSPTALDPPSVHLLRGDLWYLKLV